MTATELQLAKLASRQTSAIAVILMAGSLIPGHSFDINAGTEVLTGVVNIRASLLSTPSYHDVFITDSNEISDGHVADAFLDMHDKLISEQTELDSESEKILCNNLWDLYI